MPIYHHARNSQANQPIDPLIAPSEMAGAYVRFVGMKRSQEHIYKGLIGELCEPNHRAPELCSKRIGL